MICLSITVKEREGEVKEMTLEEHKMLAQKYIDPSIMTCVIAGDAKTQLKQMQELGIGEPILVDKDGNIVQ